MKKSLLYLFFLLLALESKIDGKENNLKKSVMNIEYLTKAENQGVTKKWYELLEKIEEIKTSLYFQAQADLDIAEIDDKLSKTNRTKNTIEARSLIMEKAENLYGRALIIREVYFIDQGFTDQKLIEHIDGDIEHLNEKILIHKKNSKQIMEASHNE